MSLSTYPVAHTLHTYPIYQNNLGITRLVFFSLVTTLQWSLINISCRHCGSGDGWVGGGGKRGLVMAAVKLVWECGQWWFGGGNVEVSVVVVLVAQRNGGWEHKGMAESDFRFSKASNILCLFWLFSVNFRKYFP